MENIIVTAAYVNDIAIRIFDNDKHIRKKKYLYIYTCVMHRKSLLQGKDMISLKKKCQGMFSLNSFYTETFSHDLPFGGEYP